MTPELALWMDKILHLRTLPCRCQRTMVCPGFKGVSPIARQPAIFGCQGTSFCKFTMDMLQARTRTPSSKGWEANLSAVAEAVEVQGLTQALRPARSAAEAARTPRRPRAVSSGERVAVLHPVKAIGWALRALLSPAKSESVVG